jgi:hypothetical protein
MKITVKYFFFNLILIFFTSCFNEDQPSEDAENTIMEITESLHQEFFEYEIMGGTLTTPLSVSNDGLDGIYGLNMADIDNLDGQNLLFFSCINGLNTNLLQKANLRNALADFSECRQDVAMVYLAELQLLLEQAEVVRQDINQRFESESIGQEEAENLLQIMRDDFEEDYILLKESYGDDFEACLETAIRSFNSTLNASQWGEFTSCIES